MMTSEGRSILLSATQSLVATAARTKQSVIVNDVFDDPAFLPNPLLPNTSAEMAVPIMVGNTVLGVLDIQSSEANYFTESDIQVQATLASQIAIALENARIFSSNQQLVSIVANSNDFIGLADMKGKVVYVNPAGLEMTGYSSVQNLTIETLHPEADFRHMEQTAVPAALKYGLWQGQRYLVTADGSQIPTEQTLFIIYDVDGEPRNIATIMTDITERLQSEQEIRRRAIELQTVAEVSVQATQALDVNELLAAVANLTRERFNLYHAHIYLYDEESNRLVLAAGAGEVGRIMAEQGRSIGINAATSLVARAAREREGIIVNNVLDSPDFLPNPLLPETRAEMAVPMVAGNELIGVLDVQSERIDRFDDEDVRVKSTLASQIAVAIQNARLYTEQVEAAEQLREVDRLKSEFLASMSHELRTPLNSIIGYAEVILDGIDGPINEDMEEDVSAIHSSGKLLLNLINDILDLAKIESGQLDLDFTPMSVQDFVKEMVDASSILVKNKNLTLNVEIDPNLPLVQADRIRVQQIMNNLISNAVKFTDEGGIKVRAEQQDGMVMFSVTDSGMGIPKAKQDLIFERFRQADQSSTRRAGGTGLGLAITRQLVEMHGGTIWVESEEGVGSTFAFTLPVAVQAEPGD
jgi:PAS domain S-box-containing protein